MRDPVDFVQPDILAATLVIMNELRIQAKLPPLTAMPCGNVGAALSCPVHNALAEIFPGGDLRTYRTYMSIRYSPFGTYEWAWPQVVTSFIDQFDELRRVTPAA